jgi:uncharacterized protein (DUF2141 family)
MTIESSPPKSRVLRSPARRRALLRWACAALASLFVTASAAGGEANVPQNEILLSVTVGAAKGRVLCGVYERGGWLKRTVKGSAASFQGKVATCRFRDLKPGTYAAGAFQDENSNGKFDRAWTGLPKEPWCVSRGARGTIGPPSFESAKFAVTEGTVRLNCSAR